MSDELENMQSEPIQNEPVQPEVPAEPAAETGRATRTGAPLQRTGQAAARATCN